MANNKFIPLALACLALVQGVYLYLTLTVSSMLVPAGAMGLLLVYFYLVNDKIDSQLVGDRTYKILVAVVGVVTVCGLFFLMSGRTYGEGVVMLSLMAEFLLSNTILKLVYTILFVRK